MMDECRKARGRATSPGPSTCGLLATHSPVPANVKGVPAAEKPVATRPATTEDTDMQRSVDQGAIRADWQKRGFSFGLFTDPPGQVWADFVHATDELVMVIEGDVEFEIAGEKHRPRVGEEL